MFVCLISGLALWLLIEFWRYTREAKEQENKLKQRSLLEKQATLESQLREQVRQIDSLYLQQEQEKQQAEHRIRQLNTTNRELQHQIAQLKQLASSTSTSPN